jgi:hypothetical protein
MSIMRDLPKLALLTVAGVVAAVVMIGLTGAYIVVVAGCCIASGIFLTFAAMAGLMWVLSGQPATWGSMLHALSYGVVFGAIATVAVMSKGLLGLGAESSRNSLRPPSRTSTGHLGTGVPASACRFSSTSPPRV